MENRKDSQERDREKDLREALEKERKEERAEAEDRETEEEIRGAEMTEADEDLCEKMLRDIVPSLPEQEQFETRLQKKIHRRISKISLKVVLVVLSCFAVIILALDPMYKAAYYNPLKKQKAHTRAESASDLVLYLNSYASVFLPYCEVYDAEVEDHRFGNYTIRMGVIDKRDSKIMIGGENDATSFQMKRGKITRWENAGIFCMTGGRFSGYTVSSVADGEILSELEKLPESALISCSLRLPEPVLPRTLVDEKVSLEWLCVEQDAVGLEVGICPFRHLLHTEEEERLNDQWTKDSSILKEFFLRDLDFLLEDEALLQMLGVGGGSFSLEEGDPEETIESLEKNLGPGDALEGHFTVYMDGAPVLKEIRDAVAAQDEIYTKKICVMGQKRDILDYIARVGASTIYVDGVKLSRWSD